MPVQFVEICTCAIGTKKKARLNSVRSDGDGDTKESFTLKGKVKAKSD